MSTRIAPEPHRPLIDPIALEEAGRHFRVFLHRLLGRTAAEPDTSIAWESGEPEEKSGPPQY